MAMTTKILVALFIITGVHAILVWRTNFPYKWDDYFVNTGPGLPKEFQTFTSENVKIENNELVLMARYINGILTGARVYWDGIMKFKYGRLKIVAKMPNVYKCLIPRLELLGIEIKAWPQQGQINICNIGIMNEELYEEQMNKKIKAGLIFWDYENSENKTELYDVFHNQSLNEDYHIYEINKTKTEIRIMIDGKTIFYGNSDTNKGVKFFEDKYVFPVFTLAVGGEGTGCNYISQFSAELPAMMRIKSMELYQDELDVVENYAGARIGIIADIPQMVKHLDFTRDFNYWSDNKGAEIETNLENYGNTSRGIQMNPIKPYYGVSINAKDYGTYDLSECQGGKIYAFVKTLNKDNVVFSVKADIETKHQVPDNARTGNWTQVNISLEYLDMSVTKVPFYAGGEPRKDFRPVQFDEVYCEGAPRKNRTCPENTKVVIGFSTLCEDIEIYSTEGAVLKIVVILFVFGIVLALLYIVGNWVSMKLFHRPISSWRNGVMNCMHGFIPIRQVDPEAKIEDRKTDIIADTKDPVNVKIEEYKSGTKPVSIQPIALEENAVTTQDQAEKIYPAHFNINFPETGYYRTILPAAKIRSERYLQTNLLPNIKNAWIYKEKDDRNNRRIMYIDDIEHNKIYMMKCIWTKVVLTEEEKKSFTKDDVRKKITCKGHFWPEVLIPDVVADRTKHCIKVYQWDDYWDEKEQTFYFEFAAEWGGKNLAKYVADNGINFGKILEFSIHAVKALKIMASLRMFHFDIKPDNFVIYIEENGKEILKLIDFGSGCILSEEQLANFMKSGIKESTIGYRPPELKVSRTTINRIFPEKIDVYCWAATFTQILSGRTYADLMNEHHGLINLKNSNIGTLENLHIYHANYTEEKISEIRRNYSNDPRCEKFVNVLEKCLSYVPPERPTFEEIYENIKEFDNNMEEEKKN